ncbi:MAG TPA: OB-fold domain-containing protein, partial [Acidimicrobiales bacterium]|nr:OB-fold domain-containing protein [Acidimicrobiales bacterium]
HHPQMPGFEYPLAVGLVELEEGTRIVAPLVGVDPADVQIGAPVEARIAPGTGDGEARLAFAPMVEDDTSGAAAAPRRVKAGESLPDLDVPLTRTLIVAGAIATRDYQDVHHDVVLAHAKGSPDIFMNILTTNGWVGRFVTDWAGPEARIESVAIRLGAPNYPDDRMVMSGKVVSVEALGDDSVRLTVGLKGSNSIGDHVSGTVTLRMPGVPG